MILLNVQLTLTFFSEVLSFHEILQKSFKTKTNETYFPKLVTEL